MKTFQLALYERALRFAAEEAYQAEVIDTEMEELMIGEGLDYPTKDDFIEERILYWIGKAEDELPEQP